MGFWYNHFHESANGVDEHFTLDHLLIAHVKAISESDLSTKQDLRELFKAYNELKKGAIMHEQPSKSVSAV
ncbi:hypothetical protein JYK21_07205 [Ralstonia pickettii]|nr:hypothetical protein [Ralstonia pickettii]